PDRAFQLARIALGIGHEPPVGGAVHAFAVNAHAGGDDEALERPLLRARAERYEQEGRASPVDIGVVGHLVPALADPNPGREMEHVIDIDEGAAYRSWRTNIADHQLDAPIEIARRAPVAAMDLRVEIIERLHPIIVLKQQSGAVGRDEPRTASDQNRLVHSVPAIGFQSPGKRTCLPKGSNVLAETRKPSTPR